MSSIDQLIKIKNHTQQEDDILVVLEELATYEKLSKAKAFRDFHTSKPMQKKLPFLWNALNGDVYAQSLFSLAGNIIAHLTSTMPQVITDHINTLKETDQRRLLLLTNHALKIRYMSISSYNHEDMKDSVVGVFTEDITADTTNIIIITKVATTVTNRKAQQQYEIYQGTYNPKESVDTVVRSSQAFPSTTISNNDGVHPMTITIQTYSVQGNNAYPFATVKSNRLYSIMIPNHNELWILPHDDMLMLNLKTVEPIRIELTVGEKNILNMGKPHLETFAQAILNIIKERVITYETT